MSLPSADEVKVKAMRAALINDVINAAHETNRGFVPQVHPDESWFESFIGALEGMWVTLEAVDPDHRFPKR